jgi:hypothetical protein
MVVEVGYWRLVERKEFTMTLPTRVLGSSGLDVTRVGFGAWAIGGGWAFGWGPQDEDASIAAMPHALERTGAGSGPTAHAPGAAHV